MPDTADVKELSRHVSGPALIWFLHEHFTKHAEIAHCRLWLTADAAQSHTHTHHTASFIEFVAINKITHRQDETVVKTISRFLLL